MPSCTRDALLLGVTVRAADISLIHSSPFGTFPPGGICHRRAARSGRRAGPAVCVSVTGMSPVSCRPAPQHGAALLAVWTLSVCGLGDACGAGSFLAGDTSSWNYGYRCFAGDQSAAACSTRRSQLATKHCPPAHAATRAKKKTKEEEEPV